MPEKRIGISLSAAFAGLARTVKSELNFQIELVLMVLAVVFGILLPLSMTDWILIVITITFVLGFELLNTAFERLSDLQKPRLDPVVKLAKDASAAAVLVSSVGALIIGILVFGPHLAAILL